MDQSVPGSKRGTESMAKTATTEHKRLGRNQNMELVCRGSRVGMGREAQNC